MNNITIGVTGHRYIKANKIPTIEHQVTACLSEIICKHPDATIILQSPLAVGADQLVAWLAIQEGMKLHVPLPMPLADYLQDFNEEESKGIKELLSHASKIWVPSEKNLGRPNGYVMVGCYIAQTSDYILALWDGKNEKEKEFPGGTGHIVKLIKQQGIFPYLYPNNKQPVLYHILAPREFSI
ncbi:hypothetical protein [Priestia megaterium]